MTSASNEGADRVGSGPSWHYRGESLSVNSGCLLPGTETLLLPLSNFKSRAASCGDDQQRTSAIIALDPQTGDRRVFSGFDPETQSLLGEGPAFGLVSQVLSSPEAGTVWALSNLGLFSVDTESARRECLLTFTSSGLEVETGETGARQMPRPSRWRWLRASFSLVLGPIAHYLPFGLGSALRQFGAYRFTGRQILSSLPMAGHAPKKLLKTNHIIDRQTMVHDAQRDSCYFSFAGGGGAGILAYQRESKKWSVVSYHGIVEQLHRGSGYRGFSQPLQGLQLYQGMLYGYSAESQVLLRIDPDDGERSLVSGGGQGTGPTLYGGCSVLYQDALFCVGLDEQARFHLTRVDLDSGNRSPVECSQVEGVDWAGGCGGITPLPNSPGSFCIADRLGILAVDLEQSSMRRVSL